MVNISNLPNEMLFEIFLHLDIESALSSMLVSKRFYSVIMSNWNRINKKVKVESLAIVAKQHEIGFLQLQEGTVLSLCGDYFGNLRLVVEDALVQCVYDVSAKNTALVRAVKHYFTHKLAYWNYNHHNPSKHRMEFKSVCPMASLRDLLLFLLPLIEIQKLVGMNFYGIEQNHLDCFIEAFRTTDCTRIRGVPVQLYSPFSGYQDFCRALRSPEVTFTGVFDYRELDTSLEIAVRVPDINLNRAQNLIKEWYTGERTIFHFIAKLTPDLLRYTMPGIHALRSFLLDFHSGSIIRETDVDIVFHLRRPKTKNVLEISCSTSNVWYMAAGNWFEFSAKEI